MLLEKNSRLIMAGDSVTDCGRNYDAIPAGWGSFGDGYVSLVNACLTTLAPEQEIMVVNRGVSGNNIRDLNARWERDVLALKPDYISVMIGINDVWRYFDAPLQQPEFVDKTEFEDTYCTLMEKTLPQVRGMFVMSPFMAEPNRGDPMRKTVEEYAAIARRTAEKYKVPYIDVQAKVDRFLQSLSSYVISSDRVHPNLQGHMILAKAFLDAVRLDWNA